MPSTVEERFAVATVMDRSALSTFDALPSCDALSKASRAAGYRGSDLVRWHSTVSLWSRKDFPLLVVLPP